MGPLDALVHQSERLRAWVTALRARRRARRYARSARRVGDVGYAEFKVAQLEAVVRDRDLCARIATGGPLPEGFGRGLDERIVEYPWVLGRLPADARIVLDAGSTLNHGWLCTAPVLRDRRILVVTLAPEGRVDAPHYSFLYNDLRDLWLRTACVEAVVCLSTLEHVGMDNSRYTGVSADRAPASHLQAFDELVRVLRPGGDLLITVPFGRTGDHGWLQVFTGPMIDALRTRFPGHCLAESYYRASTTGWVTSTRAACEDAEFRDDPSPVADGHRAISAGAICALHLRRASS